ncbi:MAG TPA: CocE/NonD family hydrolase [Beijerinckiaceae bacterium]
MKLNLPDPSAPSNAYERPPQYDGLIEERDVYVAMRDGVEICVDVYRPPTEERLPALLAFSIYNKDLQGPDVAASLPPQPAWAPLWAGLLEAGDTRFFVARGYVHVIGSPRGVGKSQGGGSRQWDSYDLIEWIARQPWCDGQVGMIGISGFGAEQLHAAKQKPPSLKAIFPFDPRGAYGTLGGFREEHPGGVLHVFRYLIGHFSAFHQDRGAPKALSGAREEAWRAAMANPDFRQYPHVLNVLSQRGEHMPGFFETLIDPYDREEWVRDSERAFGDVETPAYLGSGWYAYTYKTHLNGAQSWFANLSCPRKLLFLGPGHLERPFHTLHGEMLRWHDHWLKGLDTGVLDEPPVRYWVMGANAWRAAADWPPPEAQWTKLYLKSWGRLALEPPTPASVDEIAAPDSFVQMPPTRSDQLGRLRYMTEPLSRDTLLAGPMTLTLYAAIDKPDTNWFVVVKDIGPDPSVRTAREGERGAPADLPEREVTRGWLKASMRALDPQRSKPWKPWHRLTREAQAPAPPGEIVEYTIEIMATANLFRQGHRICLDIMAADLPTGVGGATNAEYIPYHLCSAETVLHHVHHDARHPSHLLVPFIADG